jgi:TolB-like protein
MTFSSTLTRTTPRAALILVAFTAACATAGNAPVSTRATAISEADRQAKDALAHEASIDVSRIPARSVAILPFAVSARDTLLTPLGYAMAEFMMTDLAHANQLTIVDRMRTDAIFRELDLVDKGVVDPRGAPRVGRLIGARQLLIGSVGTAPNGDVQFSARVVDVLSGTVANLLSASAPLARVIDAEKALALRVAEELGVTLTPAQRIAIEQRQTNNVQAMVAFGKGLQAEAKGDIPGAMAQFEEASRMDAAFSAARTQMAAVGAPAASRGGSSSSSSRTSSSVQRVLDNSVVAVNAPIGVVPAKLPEAVDVPVASSTLTFLITVRVF